MKTMKLKRFALRDAYLTAPANIGFGKLLLRLAGTFYESLYGKERFDYLVIGDDLIVSLACALRAARDGKTVLIAADSLSNDDLPHKDWPYELGRFANSFDEVVAQRLAPLVDGIDAETTYLQAVSILIKACAATKRVHFLKNDYLQSSAGHIKASKRLMFFPLQPQLNHRPTINPLWKIVGDKLPAIGFARKEIEYVEAGCLIYSSPVSHFIDSGAGQPVGIAQNKPTAPEQHTRAETVASALTINLGAM